jgi:hypothetical protein
MAVIIPGQQHTVIKPRQHRFQTLSWPAPMVVYPALRASKFGGLGLVVLMLTLFIPWPANMPGLAMLAQWVIAFVVISLATGLLAVMLAGETITTMQQAGEISWVAGFWAGILGGIFAMFLAAHGVLLQSFGQGVARNIYPLCLSGWQFVFSPEVIALIGRVIGAFMVYGLISALVMAIISTIGGMLFSELKMTLR